SVHSTEPPAKDLCSRDQQCFLSLLRIDKSLDCLNKDAKHQSGGKNRVAKSSQHICPAEAVSVSLVPSDTTEPNAEQTYDHGDQVRENSKGYRDLNSKKHEAHHAHEDEPAAPARVAAHFCCSLPLTLRFCKTRAV
uniref:Uncharacterized protein n=1 Tax=Aquila chrysaetos chrysaetos TaxID=223781 RepID=A0A663F8L1_AQUCH